MIIRFLETIDRMLWTQPVELYDRENQDEHPTLDIVELEERVMYSAVPFVDPSELPADPASLEVDAESGDSSTETSSTDSEIGATE